MINTDIMLWQNSASSADTTDMWSTRNGKPMTDTQQDLSTSTVRDSSSGAVTYTTLRSLETGD